MTQRLICLLMVVGFAALLLSRIGLGTGRAAGAGVPNTPSNTVTMRGLLEEMVDPDVRARWPEPAFTTRQASSYDRHRTAPNQPGWFDNEDHSHYIRAEVHAGREEQVMMDAEGPSALVRFFLTSAGPRTAYIRVYLDGSDTPAIEWPTYDLLGGSLNVGEPLQAQHPPPLDGGSTLYLPIPYAHHCKVTVEEADPAHAEARYYQIDYRTYVPGTSVATFTEAALDAARLVISRVNQQLSNPPRRAQARPLALTVNCLPEGKRLSICRLGRWQYGS